ncbi:type I polyketide synthase [Nocardia amikacinitolerans]|uniref:type I polyketide synthase n=1 Tax=Nocardia amikacinitolerans TaxID=756689 RepID=UPI0009FD8590|nr:type I polyketide synthase [Nocardia amikacinitolerans]
MGLADIDHPLLGAFVYLPDTEGTIFTGHISLQTQPWLREHVVHGTIVLPGVAFVDLLLFAARSVECGRIEELVHHEFLAISESGARDIQVKIDTADASGRRPVAVYSRPARSPQSAEWTRHATGFLAPTTPQSAVDLGVWPPAGATSVDVDEFYHAFLSTGYQYGPMFQGFEAGWTLGDDIYAEIALPNDVDPENYGIHPALMDSALHPLMLWHDSDYVLLPFSWNGVSLHSNGGARRLRVRLTRLTDGVVSLLVADDAGLSLVTIESLTLRSVTPDQLAAARAATGATDSLYVIEWSSLTAQAAQAVSPRYAVLGDPPTASVLQRFGLSAEDYAELSAVDTVATTILPVLTPSSESDMIAAAHTTAAQVLETMQQFLAAEHLSDRPLIVLTQRAVATTADDIVDPAAAVAWGLVRSAQSENPGRFVLIDHDDSPESWHALATALASDEPQLSLRSGRIAAPRLQQHTSAPQLVPIDPSGTVLITGGTGTLGQLLARHLVLNHRVHHLHLISRRGPYAAGAANLLAELTAFGASVTITAGDAGDRSFLEGVLTSISDDHPLTAVFHTAGLLHDAMLPGLTPQHMREVLEPKIDAAWHLHQLTREHNLHSFVMYSSAAGTIGTPGQANYAAANSFLDALAHYRRTQGLPAHSLAWGLWGTDEGMGAALTAADLARLARRGIVPMEPTHAMNLLDAALASSHAFVIPAQLQLPGAAPDADQLPTLMRGLIRSAGRRTRLQPQADSDFLHRQLAGRSNVERQRILLDLVLRRAAASLGHGNPETLDPETGFLHMGMDSLIAVELRNVLSRDLGRPLPATTLFDYPTPLKLASYLEGRLAPAETASSLPFSGELDLIENSLAAMRPDLREGLSDRLRQLLATLDTTTASESHAAHNITESLTEATDDEMFDFIDNELGLRSDGK